MVIIRSHSYIKLSFFKFLKKKYLSEYELLRVGNVSLILGKVGICLNTLKSTPF
jgi:hypothetical protein